MKIIIILFILTLYSCGDQTILAGYTKDLYQGTMLSDGQIQQININMSKSEVKRILGSPTIIDAFHQNRWDYIDNSRVDGTTTTKNLILLFNNNNQLQKITNNY